MARKSVDIAQYAMKDIFDGSDRYIVPLFQREYKWTEEKGLVDFWDDLTQHYNDETERKTPYHFGPIMLINENEAVKDFRVVDGQQRLTTSLLLLIAARDLFYELDEKDEVAEIEEYIYARSDTEEKTPRIKLSALNNDWWERKILPVDKFSAKRESIFGDVDKRNKVLCAAYRYLGDNLKKEVLEKNNVKNLVKFYEHFLKDFVIVESLISSTRRAFKMFERINYRGVGLAENDLAKNYLLEQINGDAEDADFGGDENEVVASYETWNDILRRLDLIGLKDTDYLRHYLMAFVRATKKDRVFDTILEHIKGKKDALDFLKDLDEGVSLYSRLKKPEKEDWRQYSNGAKIIEDLEAIKALDSKAVYPVLLKACKREEEGNSIGDFGELVNMLLIFFFRTKTICSLSATAIENVMNTICTELRGTTIDMPRIRSILKGDAIDKNSQRKISSPYPNDDEFEMKFKLYDTQSAGRARYILTELEYNLQGGRNRASAVPNPKAEVEHIMPKKIEKTKWDSDLRDKLGLVKKVERNNYHLLWRDRLGNKTLLSSGKNASIQNLPFKDKMQKAYATDPLKITSGLSDYTKWDGKEIERRQAKFASDALNIWHL